jgi:hypothetical protein
MSPFIKDLPLGGYSPVEATMESAIALARSAEKVEQIAITEDSIWVREHHGGVWILMFIMVDGAMMAMNNLVEVATCGPLQFKELVEPHVIDDINMTDNGFIEPERAKWVESRSGGKPFWTLGPERGQKAAGEVTIGIPVGDGMAVGTYVPTQNDIKAFFEYIKTFPGAHNKLAPMQALLFEDVILLRFGDGDYRILAIKKDDVLLVAPRPQEAAGVSQSVVDAMKAKPREVFP